eukprot:comp8757_c0_seq1/m.3991 comp8757_c0_seq1/g.3991  ORF comp8757_c0_seq1/g.3991 comp8757_c0_seq1/m.3991 type:complete len:249 (-) comp8757_c0_seq1:772-1518(-)
MVYTDNICLWPGCKLTFKTTEDLILHVEDDHVRESTSSSFFFSEDDHIPETVHLSCVSPFFTETQLAARRNSQERVPCGSLKRRESECSDTPDLVEEYVLEDGNGMLTPDSLPSPTSSTHESVFVLDGMNSDDLPVAEIDDIEDRPYICPVPGCGKRYKNPNGIKYHTVHGHTNEALQKKPYKCKIIGCGKRYTNVSGLRHHFNQRHPKEPYERFLAEIRKSLVGQKAPAAAAQLPAPKPAMPFQIHI